MTFFEQELRKLFADGAVIKNPRFAGRACFGTLGKDLRVRVQFVTSGHADHYDAMSVSVLNRTDGVVDKLRIRLKDVLGIKPVPGNPNFRNGVSPYIWDDHGKAEWYAFRPSGADYDAMRQAVGEYLDVFRERAIEREHTGPKLIYICAPPAWGGGKEYRLRQRESAGGVRGGRHPHLPPSDVPSHCGPGKPRTGPGGTGDGPAAGGVLPADQCLWPRLDRWDVGGDPPRRNAGDPRHDRSERVGQDAAQAKKPGQTGKGGQG